MKPSFLCLLLMIVYITAFFAILRFVEGVQNNLTKVSVTRAQKTLKENNMNFPLKEEAYAKLLTEYIDSTSMVSLKPVEGLIVDNENGHLFTGEAAILVRILFENRRLKQDDLDAFEQVFTKSFINTRIRMGLNSRRPIAIESFSHPMSRDELLGLVFGLVNFGFEEDLGDLLAWGENHHRMWLEESPDLKTTFLDIFKNYTRYRFPDTMYMIKAGLGRKTSFIEEFMFCASAVLTSFKTQSETSGKIMDFFSFKVLEMKSVNTFMVRVAKSIVKFNYRRVHGEDYLKDMVRVYFKNEAHPFHEMSAGIKLE
jgi:hypothetical protein